MENVANLMIELRVARVFQGENLLEVKHTSGGRQKERVARERRLERFQAAAARGGGGGQQQEVAFGGGDHTEYERRVARGCLQLMPTRAEPDTVDTAVRGRTRTRARVGRVARAGADLGRGGARALRGRRTLVVRRGCVSRSGRRDCGGARVRVRVRAGRHVRERRQRTAGHRI